MVERNHHFPPKDAPFCILCADKGLHRHNGEWNFCGCPMGFARKIREPRLADESNATLRALEKRTGGK